MIQQAYGRESLSQAQVFRWHKMFKEGRESVVDELRAGRPSTSRTAENEQRARHLLNTDRRLSVRMIAAISLINYFLWTYSPYLKYTPCMFNLFYVKIEIFTSNTVPYAIMVIQWELGEILATELVTIQETL
ncbi:uncharacterized protein TNCV_2344431 [Trichonephila clavipes]|nr:uncharacterized protein TNCV_2344431 [Trichonephila clavipes]